MNTRDVVVLSVLLVAFAALVTAHVAIAAGLLRRPRRWQALVAFVVAPLAPYFALRAHMRIRAFAWIGALVVYASAAVLARS